MRAVLESEVPGVKVLATREPLVTQICLQLMSSNDDIAALVERTLCGRGHEPERTSLATASLSPHGLTASLATMPTKITVIYDNPTDPIAFESGYAAEQVELAKKLPGLQKIETSKVWPKEDGSPTPLYRMVDLYFSDYDSASAAVTTPEAAALFPEHLRARHRWCPDRVLRHRGVLNGSARLTVPTE